MTIENWAKDNDLKGKYNKNKMFNSMSNHENLTRHCLPSLELLKQKW